MITGVVVLGPDEPEISAWLIAASLGEVDISSTRPRTM